MLQYVELNCLQYFKLMSQYFEIKLSLMFKTSVALFLNKTILDILKLVSQYFEIKLSSMFKTGVTLIFKLNCPRYFKISIIIFLK